MADRSIRLLAVWLLFFIPVRARADNVDDYIRAEMQERRLPAVAVLVIRDGKIIKQKAYGLANVELNVPATNDTVFHLASITKTFTATAVMTLVEEGKISLDDKVRKVLPFLPVAWRGVTVRHLLTHTSGLPDVSLGDDTDEVIAQTRDEALKKLARMPATSRPGAKWSYNQTGYVLLAMIIEKVTGGTYEEYLRRRFFQPLGMSQTSFGDSREVIPNRASGYTRYERQVDHDVSPNKIWNYQNVFPPYLNGAGGLNTTTGDLANWDVALSEGRILKRSTLDEMWRAVKLNSGVVFRFGDSTLGYGGGWMVDERPSHKAVGHSGGDSTAYIRYLDDKLSVVVLTNCQGADPDSLVSGIAALYIPALAQGVK